MTIYVCLHCEYKFDSEKGDPAYNIPAGKTPADMPDDWVCPECYEDFKEMFGWTLKKGTSE